MPDQSEALCNIALAALNALVAGTEDHRHRELWKLARARVQQTCRNIVADDEIKAARQEATPGQTLGRQGGIVRAKNLSSERRTEIARRAALARWGSVSQ